MRTRSPQNVYEEVKWIKENLPQVRDISFDDDTFSADRNHARAVAEKIAPLGVSWVINARANCDFETLRIMRDAGLHHVIVGYESGDEQILKNIKKGCNQGPGGGVHPELQEARHHHPWRLHHGPSR